MASSYAYVKRCIAERRAWVNTLKMGPCSRCQRCFHPVCMDFHHLDRTTKSFEIGSASYKCSREKLLTEIAKCILLCSNCHRLTEHEQKINFEGEGS